MTKHKKETSRSRIWIGAIVTIILLIGVGSFLALTSRDTPAFIYVDAGSVLVDTGKGWQSAHNEMKLGSEDRIKTESGARATIIFYESEVLQLDPNTEVSIAELKRDHVSVEQQNGKVWNRIAHLTGTRGYDVTTPTSVATVRGTSFGVLLGTVAEHVVGSGTVQCASSSTSQSITAMQNCLVYANGTLIITDVTIEQKLWIKQQHLNSIDALRKLRQREIEKHPIIYRIVKKSQGWTDVDVQRLLTEADDGVHDLEEAIAKAPIKAKSVEKVYYISKEIQELKEQIAALDAELDDAAGV